MSGHDVALRNADLPYRLRALGMAGGVLHLGSHPDDEETGLMAYLSRGRGVRTVYWSATRGEGGQNRSGPERGEALGILRTWESLDARAVDGGEVLYGPFFDFGFSKSGEDCLARWDREALVREIVRAIRFVQPLVVLSRWTGTPNDGHGQHQAIGLVAGEAFAAAADPSRFPELQELGLPPWQALKLYRSTLGDWQPEEDVAFGVPIPELESPGVLRVDTGEVDPISGRTLQELGWLGVNRHRTQAMSFVPWRGAYVTYLRLERSLVPVPERERDLFDGLDPTISGLADLAGGDLPALRPLLVEADARASEGLSRFRPDRPQEAGRVVLEGLALLRKARGLLAEAGVGGDHLALDMALRRKGAEFEEVAARCLGFELECLVDEDLLTPGRRLLVRSRLWSDESQTPPLHADIRLEVPDGWTSQRLNEPSDGDPDDGRTPVLRAAFDVRLPEGAALSSPYWLQAPREPYRYAWPETPPPGIPFDDPLISAICELRLGPHRLSISQPAVHREAYGGGFREKQPVVVPPVSLLPREPQKIIPVRHEGQRLDLRLAARSMQDDIAGTLVADAPDGWDVHPSELEVTFDRVGSERAVHFEATVPPGVKPGVHSLRYRITSRDRDYGVVLQPVWRRTPGHPGTVDESSSIERIYVMAPATVSIHLVDAEFVTRLRCGYIAGAQEDILESLEHFGLSMTALSPEELSYADLRSFDAIVVGPNAYVVREDVRRNAARLLEYVEGGGTMIVQYQSYPYQHPGLAPHPFRFRQPHDRVTRPDASLTVLEPNHAVLSFPNQITAEDFDGWVHDRGLYFFGEWDKRYLPLLETADPGERPLRGGLLVSSYGRGTYVYAGLSFFRQIPAGVPGAIRLFANLLGVAEARILERAGRLRHVPLFASMTEEQRYEVARLISERWMDAGTYLCREGDRGRELFMILDGEVEVLKGRDDRLIALVGPDDVVGELAVLADLPRSATLRAKSDVKVLAMQGVHFREFLRKHAELGERMISMLATRLGSAEVRW